MPRKQAPRVEFSQAKFDEICARIAAGGDASSLRQICAETGMPTRQTFNEWRKRTPELEAQYDRACEDRKDTFFDELIHIADTEKDPAIARNRMDARKWSWARMDRARFGDRVTNELVGEGGGAVIHKVEFEIVDTADPGPEKA
jgi:hypothetical protein